MKIPQRLKDLKRKKEVLREDYTNCSSLVTKETMNLIKSRKNVSSISVEIKKKADIFKDIEQQFLIGLYILFYISNTEQIFNRLKERKNPSTQKAILAIFKGYEEINNQAVIIVWALTRSKNFKIPPSVIKLVCSLGTK